MKNSEQPAFPVNVDEAGEYFVYATGFTKREYAAIKAMEGILASNWGKRENPEMPSRADIMCNQVVEAAIKTADLLLSELEKTKPE